jgi:hypothetical protein
VGLAAPGEPAWVLTPWLLCGRALPDFRDNHGIDVLTRHGRSLKVSALPGMSSVPRSTKTLSRTGALAALDSTVIGGVTFSYPPRTAAADEAWVCFGVDELGGLIETQAGDLAKTIIA